ncbi:T9SS type A sorting domain-containing protein [uncultured Kordia sp.]|uniref:T9SS type A sorting domain-containing protein n=1 Tax=uncultured Kordia sp. TaxID=507699 RepID=UPI002623A25C|nr:T9SS type A sorting domain-containing protein [uncultured Kordia sp.]
MKKYYLLLTIFLIGSSPLFSQDLDTYNFIKTSVNGYDLWNYAFTTDGTGNIYATGKLDNNNTNYEEIVTIKYMPNGVLDTSFGTDGIFTYDFGSMIYQRGIDIAIDANGKILVTGYAAESFTHRNLFVIRLNQNGTLDTSFNTDGVLEIDNGYSNTAYKIIVDDNDEIFVGGTISTSTVSQLAIIKLNDDGTYDTTFNLDGISVTDLGNSSDNNYISDMNILPDGKIMTLANTEYSILLVRFTDNGQPDTTYGSGNGIYEYSSGSTSFEYYASEFHINTDDTIFILATKYCVGCNPGSGSNTNRFIFKMNANGAYDNTFNGNGEYFIDDFFSPRVSMAVSPTQEVYIAVKLFDFQLRKLTSSGNLDTSFYGDGSWNPSETERRKMYPLEMNLNASGELMILGKSTLNQLSDESLFYSVLPEQSNVILSVDENEVNGTFAMYPNPTNDVVYVKNDNMQASITVEIFNALGMRLFSKEISNMDNAISLKGYPAGMYYAKVLGTDTTKSILKN